VRPCSITPTGRRKFPHLQTCVFQLGSLRGQLVFRRPGICSGRISFLRLSCDNRFLPTTQPFLRATSILLCHLLLQLPPGDSLPARHIG